MPIRRMRSAGWPAIALLLAAGGCDGTRSSAPVVPPEPSAPPPAVAGAVISLRVISGDGQTGEPDQRLVSPLVLQTVDERQRPVTGVPIRFRVHSGGGHVSDSVLVSDGSGRVQQRTWTLGEDAAAPQQLVALTESGNVVLGARMAAPTRNPTSLDVLVIVDSIVFEHRAGTDRAVRLTAIEGTGSDARLSPDGREIAYSRRDAPTVCIASLDRGATRCVTQAGATMLLVEDWLEDNTNLLLRAVSGSCTPQSCRTTTAPLMLDRSTMRLTPPPSGARPPAVFGSGVSTSPDGRTLAWVERGDVVLANADGSGARNITATLDAAYDAYSVGWSPDGRRLAVVLDSLAHCPMGCAQVLGVIEPDGSRLRILQGDWNSYNIYKWSPDGAYLAYSGHACDTERCTNGPVYAMSMNGVRVTVAARGRILGMRQP